MGQSPVPTVELVAAAPAETARRLKAEDGLDIWVVGGGKLAHALLPEIDRLILKQHASVIGSGTPMFDGPFQRHLFRLTDTRQLDSGVRMLSFDRHRLLPDARKEASAVAGPIHLGWTEAVA